jgi:hypothetical protein
MTKKKSEKPMSIAAEPAVETRVVKFDLDLPTHRLLRMAAADADLSMSDWAKFRVAEALKQWKQEKGIK